MEAEPLTASEEQHVPGVVRLHAERFGRVLGILGLLAVTTVVLVVFAREASQGDNVYPQTPRETVNVLTGEMYTRLRHGDDYTPTPPNLVFSPISLTTGLAQAYLGTRGETAVNMQAALRFPLASDGRDFGALQSSVNDPEDGVTVANRLWVATGTQLRSSYETIVKREFAITTGRAPFLTNPEGAQQMISEWVESATHGQVITFLPSEALDETTRMVLVSAITMKAAWQFPFSEEFTEEEGSFDRGRVRATFMHQQHDLPYTEVEVENGETWKVLELPYRSSASPQQGHLSMILVLAPDALPTKFTSTGGVKLESWIKEARRGVRSVSVTLPRFKISWEASLRDILRQMGMTLAFSTKGDFGAMTPDGGDLALTDVLHKTSLSVDEQGTEAEALTGAPLATRATSKRDLSPAAAEFRADHPFLVFIWNDEMRVAVFAGHVVEP